MPQKQTNKPATLLEIFPECAQAWIDAEGLSPSVVADRVIVDGVPLDRSLMTKYLKKDNPVKPRPEKLISIIQDGFRLTVERFKCGPNYEFAPMPKDGREPHWGRLDMIQLNQIPDIKPMLHAKTPMYGGVPIPPHIIDSLKALAEAGTKNLPPIAAATVATRGNAPRQHRA